MKSMFAGRLRERITVLRVRSGATLVSWEAVRRVSAVALEAPGKTVIYGKFGAKLPRISFGVRPGDFTCQDCVLYDGHYWMITAIDTSSKVFTELTCAKVAIAQCESGGLCFPGVLSEKYLRHDQEEPMAIVSEMFVLIVPKCVTLASGDAVEVDGVSYGVQVGHRLDEDRNEFEIARFVDC